MALGSSVTSDRAFRRRGIRCIVGVLLTPTAARKEYPLPRKAGCACGGAAAVTPASPTIYRSWLGFRTIKGYQSRVVFLPRSRSTDSVVPARRLPEEQ